MPSGSPRETANDEKSQVETRGRSMKTRLAKVNAGLARVFLLVLVAAGIGGALIGLSVFSIVGILAIPSWVLLGSWLTAPVDHNSDSWLDAWIKSITIFVLVVVIGVFVPSYLIKLHSVAKLDVKLQDIVGTGSFAIALSGSLFVIYKSHRAGRI